MRLSTICETCFCPLKILMSLKIFKSVLSKGFLAFFVKYLRVRFKAYDLDWNDPESIRSLSGKFTILWLFYKSYGSSNRGSYIFSKRSYSYTPRSVYSQTGSFTLVRSSFHHSIFYHWSRSYLPVGVINLLWSLAKLQ